MSSIAETPQPAASRFYPFVGKWNGHGEMRAANQAAEKLALDIHCRKTAAGAAVSCEMNAVNPKMTVAETDLFGVDPIDGQGHWYTVTNTGETHDHMVDWSDAKTMKAHHRWMQEGKQMEENATITFTSNSRMEFRSTVTADGNPLVSFTGKLTKSAADR